MSAHARHAVAALAAVTLLAGCGGGGGDEADAQATDAAIPSFTYAVAAPASLDAAKNFSLPDLGIMSMFTDSLERIDAAGESTPRLASSVTEPDPQTIVYEIRDDVDFSDGSPLTVDDVVWSLQHVGGEDAQTANTLTSVASIAATGDHEVTVTLSRVDPTVRTSLALVGKIQSKAFAEAHAADLGSADAIPVGTGPYVVTSYTPSEITMARNDSYWGTAPKVDELTFTSIDSDTSAQLAMRSGDVQGARVTDLDQADKWADIPGASVFATPSLQSNFMVFDTTDPLLSDVHLRRALAYSIDREGILKAGYGGMGEVMRSFLPDQIVTGLAPSEQEGEDFLASLPSYDLDPAKAKAELAQSGYAGQTIPIYFVPELAWSKLVALNMQENLAAIGVESEPTSISRNDWLANIYAQTQKTPMPLTLSSTGIDARALSDVIGDGAFNAAKWADPVAADARGRLYDAAGGWEATKAALQEIADQVPYAPLVLPQNALVLGDGYTYEQAPTEADYSDGAFVDLLRSTT